MTQRKIKDGCLKAGGMFCISAAASVIHLAQPAQAREPFPSPAARVLEKLNALWNDPPENNGSYYAGNTFSKNWSSLYFVGIKPLKLQKRKKASTPQKRQANKRPAPPHIGWQLRAFSSVGTYHYTRNNQTINGFSQSNEAMIGYQYNAGPLWSKVYIGTHRETHLLDRSDPENPVQGEQWGLKGIWENWMNIGPYGFASADLGYSTIFRQKSAYLRTGIKYHHLLAGVEGSYQDNLERGTLSSGLFVQWDGEKFGGTVAGGLLQDSDERKNFYAHLSVSARF